MLNVCGKEGRETPQLNVADALRVFVRRDALNVDDGTVG